MRITEDFIELGMQHGGITRKQLALLGIAWPPAAGWKVHAVGREISDAAAREFVMLRVNRSGLAMAAAPARASIDDHTPKVSERTDHSLLDCCWHLPPWEHCEHTAAAAAMEERAPLWG